jgi:hypothetical protein
VTYDEFYETLKEEAGGERTWAEVVPEVFKREFPNGAVDAGARRQRDRQWFWELVYAEVVARGDDCDPAAEADHALSAWDKRWDKEGS